MPEGPEIRLAADRVAKVLVGREIIEAEFSLAPLQKFAQRLTGRKVTAVDTHGKAMLTRFDNGLTLFSHNQLYGRWYTVRRPRLPDTARQLRVALHTDTHSALLYSASAIEVLTASGVARHPFLKRLGPDILDPSLAAEDVAERLLDSEFRNRGLGNLYLQQGYLAGIGNYLRSEILWYAQVNPVVRPAALDTAAVERLSKQTLKIARRSYRTRGVTASPREAKERTSRGLLYEQYRFQIYGREGLPCYRCNTKIQRQTIASRAVFVCPSCQPG